MVTITKGMFREKGAAFDETPCQVLGMRANVMSFGVVLQPEAQET